MTKDVKNNADVLSDALQSIEKLISSIEIDQSLFKQGFTYARALVERDNKLFGGDAVHERMNWHTDAQWLQQQQALNDQYTRQLAEQRQAKYYQQLLDDKQLCQTFKTMLLSRYFPNEYHELIAPFQESIDEERQKEFKRFCSLSLSIEEEPQDWDSLQKLYRQYYNTIAAEMLEPRGFSKNRQKNGFKLWQRWLTDDVSSHVELDSKASFKRHARSGALTVQFFLNAPKKILPSPYYFFYPMHTYSYDVYRRYYSIWDMEIAVRALLSMHTIVQEPAEQLFLELLEE